MRSVRKNNGFSLTEILMAVGVLSVGLIFIASTFPPGLHFNAVSTERTIAVVAADEAFAKIQLYGIDPNLAPPIGCVRYYDVIPRILIDTAPPLFTLDEFAYPSTNVNIAQKQYRWAALCNRIESEYFLVTVFISRKVGLANRYRNPDNPSDNALATLPNPVPVPVQVEFDAATALPNELRIKYPAQAQLINDGYTIIDGLTGRLYRVIERDPINIQNIILDTQWMGTIDQEVWVVPPPAGGGRYPCIGVFQKKIRFKNP